MALGLTQPLTEMSTRNIPEGQKTALPPSINRLSKRCGGLELSHPYGPSQPVTGILFFFYRNVEEFDGLEMFLGWGRRKMDTEFGRGNPQLENREGCGRKTYDTN
jgi:hypothetical protein